MYGFIITTAGEGLLARASAGEGLTITEVWVGKGTVESAAAAKALTALLDPVAQATSTQPEVAVGQLSMLVEYRNDMGGGLEEGFTLSEFGVMAKVSPTRCSITGCWPCCSMWRGWRTSPPSPSTAAPPT